MALPLPGENSYPRTWPEVAGFVLAHPRTWVIVLGCVMAWRCFGVREWWATKHPVEANATAAETIPTPLHGEHP